LPPILMSTLIPVPSAVVQQNPSRFFLSIALSAKFNEMGGELKIYRQNYLTILFC
jgi:hypothetical protein